MCMMTSSNGIIFRVTGSLCGEFTCHRWIPLTKASDAELWCFLWYAPWINGWVSNREAGDLRHHRAHYDVIVMLNLLTKTSQCWKFKVVTVSTLCSLATPKVVTSAAQVTTKLAPWQLFGFSVLGCLCSWLTTLRIERNGRHFIDIRHAFSWKKKILSFDRFHWSLFLRVKSTIIQ